MAYPFRHRVPRVASVVKSLAIFWLGCGPGGSATTGEAPSPAPSLGVKGGEIAHAAPDSGASQIPDTLRDATAPDTAVTVDPPHGAGALPQVVSAGGVVLADPKVVIVSFSDDPLAPVLETLAAALGRSAYWAATTREYGVGALQARPPVHLGVTAPAALADAQIQRLLSRALSDPTNGLGAPDPSTVYPLSVPAGTAVTSAGGVLACESTFAGYHRSFALGDGTRIPYAVVVACASSKRPRDAATGTLSHELIEAATDPFAPTAPAFSGVGPRDLGYRISRGDLGTEVGDMCETQGKSVLVAELASVLARGWSNSAARAGANPCVPVPSGEPFFIAQPTNAPDTVVATTPRGATLEGSGFAIARGATRTLDLTLSSDGATAWTVEVNEVIPPRIGSAPETIAPRLSFALEKTVGRSGDRIALAITAVGDTAGGVPFVILSTTGATKHAWYGLVGTP